jgi:hypothetical protein
VSYTFYADGETDYQEGLEWDGKDHIGDPSQRPATEGSYLLHQNVHQVSDTPNPWPGIISEEIAYYFGVSDYPVVTYAQWTSQTHLEHMPLSLSAHIFDRHILTPPNERVKPVRNERTGAIVIRVGLKEELFGHYDPAFNVARPGPDVTPYGQTYDEDLEAAYHYAITKKLKFKTNKDPLLDPKSNHVFEDVLRIGESIDENVNARFIDPSIDMMPVVLTNERVVWVIAIKGEHGGFITIYPAYDEQNAYEKRFYHDSQSN